MGHVNNAVYLTYCEAARIQYWTDVTGEPVAAGHEGAESLILAEARITYRAPVFHTEQVTVETRTTRIGSIQLHPGASPDGVPARRRASAGRRQRVGHRPLRLRDRAADPDLARVRRRDRDVRGPRPPRLTRVRRRDPQSTTRRRMVTAFCPPNPKPSMATVSTFAGRLTSGT